MKIFKTILIFVFFILIVACSSIKSPKLIDIDRFELIQDKSDDLILKSDIKIYNPNRFSISSKDVSFNLYLDTLYLGKGNIDNGLMLIKKDTSLISSSLKLRKDQLYSLINLRDSVSLKILGSSAIPLISKRHYFDLEYKINISEFISRIAQNIIEDINIQINKVRIKKVDFSNIHLEVTFGLDNKTEMECVVKQMNINVYKTDNYKELLSSSIIKNSFRVNPMSLNEFSLDVKVNTLKMSTTFLSNTLSNNNSLFIELTSKVEYKNIEVPYSIKRRVDYNPKTLEILLK